MVGSLKTPRGHQPSLYAPLGYNKPEALSQEHLHMSVEWMTNELLFLVGVGRGKLLSKCQYSTGLCPPSHTAEALVNDPPGPRQLCTPTPVWDPEIPANPGREVGKSRGEMLMKSSVFTRSYGISPRILVTRETRKCSEETGQPLDRVIELHT